MREFAKVGVGFWTSGSIRSLSDDGKLLALYLATSPHNNQAGVFMLRNAYVMDDLGWTQQRVSKGFMELSRKGFATRSEPDFWVIIHKHIKHNPPENPNQATHVERLIAQMPRDAGIAPMVREAVIRYRERFPELVATRILNSLPAQNQPPEPDGSGTVTEGLPQPFRNKEKEKEKEKERNTLSDSPSAASDVVSLEVDKSKPSKLIQDARDVLAFLNAKAGRFYRADNDTTIEPIRHRLKDGYTVRECKAVIARKCREWRDNPDMAKYLRPGTLFRASNFAQYVGEVPPAEEIADGA